MLSEGQGEVTRAHSSLAAAGTVHKRDLSLDDNATAFMKSAQAVTWLVFRLCWYINMSYRLGPVSTKVNRNISRTSGFWQMML